MNYFFRPQNLRIVDLTGADLFRDAGDGFAIVRGPLSSVKKNGGAFDAVAAEGRALMSSADDIAQLVREGGAVFVLLKRGTLPYILWPVAGAFGRLKKAGFSKPDYYGLTSPSIYSEHIVPLAGLCGFKNYMKFVRIPPRNILKRAFFEAAGLAGIKWPVFSYILAVALKKGAAA